MVLIAVERSHVVEHDPAAAIHLRVDEARGQQPLDGVAPHARAQILLEGNSGDARSLDDDRASFEDMRAVENTSAGEGEAHHTVSVTFSRRGGLSGLRPRACAMAFTSG